MKKRTMPCICVSCPECGAVFMGSLFSIGIIKTDTNLINELEEYAKDGYTIDIRDAHDFKLDYCEHVKKSSEPKKENTLF